MSSQFEKYFYDVVIDCPYGLQSQAVYRQAHFGALPDSVMEFFLESGYRRNGNYLYTMACTGCQACVPIRLDTSSFKANRSQNRVMKKNRTLEVRTGPLKITNEKLAICDKFLSNRFPGRGNSALEYYAGFFVNSLNATYEIEFWLEERLVGVSVIDMYANAINCVYFYFDPDESLRSPGVFNILYLIEYAKRHGIQYMYLGYWIKELSAMSYKSRFKPHSLLTHEGWIEVR